MSLNIFFKTIYYESLSTWRKPADWLLPVLFFVLIISLFPMALPANSPALPTLAPGIIWVATLLSVLLSLGKLFLFDHQSGFLEQLMLSDMPLPFLVFAKLIAHFMQIILPLLLMVPLAGLFLQASLQEIELLMLGLLLGTPTLLFLGSIILGLTINLQQQNLLLLLLLLPLFVPVLIFGAGMVLNALHGFPINGEVALLAALALFSMIIVPFVTAFALRIGVNG